MFPIPEFIAKRKAYLLGILEAVGQRLRLQGLNATDSDRKEQAHLAPHGRRCAA